MKNTTTELEYRPYNGHPNWQLWNVTMWLSNDYELYKHVVSLIDRHGVEAAADSLWRELKGQSTPDGAAFSIGAIRYALRDF